MTSVLLASTLMDTNGAFLGKLEQATQVILGNYRGWVISVTSNTSQSVKTKLRDLGVIVTESESDYKNLDEKIENDHLNSLRVGLEVAKERDITKIQYTDGDRMIMAALHYPRDLTQMAVDAERLTDDKESYLNFRRSNGDFATHIPPLVETESVFCRVYAEVFGLPLDVASTSHVFSRDVVEEILRQSPAMETVRFPEPKWMIIARRMGARIASQETNLVLSFETPEQFRPQDLKEDYSLFQQVYLHGDKGQNSTLSAEEQRARFDTLGQYLGVLRNNLGIFNFESETGERYLGLIDEAISASQRRKEFTVEFLELPEDQRAERIREMRGPERDF